MLYPVAERGLTRGFPYFDDECHEHAANHDSNVRFVDDLVDYDVGATDLDELRHLDDSDAGCVR